MQATNMDVETAKQLVVDAGRALVLQDQGDFVAGHVSCRHPGDPERLLIKPGHIGLEEMTVDAVMTLDLEGEVLEGTMRRHSEVYIHTEVLKARREVNAVIHTHPPHAIAFSSLGRELLPVGNDATYFQSGLPVFSETTDLIFEKSQGTALARCLGLHKAVILRNHGIVTCGESMEEAVWVALKLERACRIQLLAEAAGGPRLIAHPAEMESKNRRANRTDLHQAVFGYLRRKWERTRGGAATT